ncbi:conditioned medium-induced protein 4 [Halovenus rubra]|uniref:Conditioned medium-induced protein 4 n=2 Tax=Halovenus rubra TaxID=869890 RepID=A0ACC7DWD3_9EURY|nr:hypothetical protein [Halovenus rubra]
MDEKTEELRDIFLDVADDETVTESQEASRGSVADTGEVDEERLVDTIEKMDERFGFTPDLSVADRAQLVEAFYDGDDDEAIGERLSVTPATVFEARMALHLVRDADPVGTEIEEQQLKRLRERTTEETAQLLEETEFAQTDIKRATAVIDATDRGRRASHRFRTTFEECLTDIDLSTQLAAETQRDGLDDATEDAEVDVEF